MSLNDKIDFLEHLKQQDRKTVSLNKYRSEITTPKNNNLDYITDPPFRNINRLFVLSFKNGNDDTSRNFFDEYYMPLVKIKNFRTLIDNKSFFDRLIKNKQEAYEKLVEMSRNNYYTT